MYLQYQFIIFILLNIFFTSVFAYTNSIGMKFKNIPAGIFYMGSCNNFIYTKIGYHYPIDDDRPKALSKIGPCPSGAKNNHNARAYEMPEHKVQISKAFQMGIYEVTVEQFNLFIKEAGRNDLKTKDFLRCNKYGDTTPVTCISWKNTQDFIQWLNNKEKGYYYRLPTEAEWEYVARAGTKTLYSWGDDRLKAGLYAWYYKNSFAVGYKHAHPVGQKKSNPWGLYDMHGNVSEWVQDFGYYNPKTELIYNAEPYYPYNDDYYLRSPTIDPRGNISGHGHIYRGGSWIDYARDLRSAYRWNIPHTTSSPDLLIGFRLVQIL